MSTSKFKVSTSLLFASALAAMGVHAYLLSQHIEVKYSANEGSAICNISDTINCTHTILSNYSEFFGVPIAVFGFVTNLLILIFALKGTFLDQDPKKSMALTISLSLFAVGASVVMGLISIFAVKSICPFCTMAYILSFVTLFSALQLTANFQLAMLFQYSKSIAIQLILVLVLGYVGGKVTLASYHSSEKQEIGQLVVAEWMSKSKQDINPIEPVKIGPDSASMKIVEFSDFLCPHCKHALPSLHKFLSSNKDVQLIFQNFPLDNCTGAENQPLLRCDLAKVAVCAQKQNKGKEAQDFLFDNQNEFYQAANIDNELNRIATHLGINENDLRTCIKNPETLKTVKAQLALGTQIGVKGTPALFINGKSLPAVAPEAFILQDIYNKIRLEK